MKKAIQWFSWGYTGLLICGALAGLLIGFTTTYGDLSGVGCNLYDAVLYGIDCRGFFGAQAIEILVSFPLLITRASPFVKRIEGAARVAGRGFLLW